MRAMELIAWPIAMGVGVSALAYLGRRSLVKSTVNRNMVAVLIGAMASLLLSHVGLLLLDLPIDRIEVVDALLRVAMGAAWTAFVDRALWPTVLFFVAAFLASAAWPDIRFFILAACNFACSIVVFWVWRPSRTPAT